MKENRLTVVLDVPADIAFKFSLNPQNTPKWINSIAKEVSSEHPPRLGTIYTNWNKDGVESEYEVTRLIEGESFSMSQKDGNYHVQYTFTSLPDHQTKFDYYEWVGSGELTHPFEQSALEQFKKIVEQ